MSEIAINDQEFRSIMMNLDRQAAKRSEAAQQDLKDLLSANTAAVENLTKMVSQIGAVVRSQSGSGSAPTSPPVSQVQIPEGNVQRITEQIRNSMETSAKLLTESNEKQFVEMFRRNQEMLQTLSQQIADSMMQAIQPILLQYTKGFQEALDKQAERFSAQLDDYTKTLSEKNHAALQEVQQENNQELQRLAQSLEQLADENHSFVQESNQQLQELRGTAEQIYDEHKAFLQKQEALMHEQTDELTAHYEKEVAAISEQLDGYAQALTERNRAALQEVQQENNLELQKLSDSLGHLSEENRSFIQVSGGHLQELRDTAKQINDAHSEFLQKQQALIKEQTDLLTAHYSEQAKVLAGQLGGYAQTITEKNRIALQEVQQENNLELQKLSDSLGHLSEENRTFIQESGKHLQGLCDIADQIKTEHSGFLQKQKALIHEQTDALTAQSKQSVSAVEGVLQQKLEAMDKQLREINRENAEQYQKTFVAANVEALTKAQSGLTGSIESTDKQLKEFAESVGLLCDDMDDYLKEAEKQQEALKEVFDEHAEQMQQQQSQATREMSKASRDMSDQYEQLCKQMQQLMQKVEKNSADYNKAIDTIRKQQAELSKLSAEDVKLLREMMKPNGKR